jgi:hypothetical protein
MEKTPSHEGIDYVEDTSVERGEGGQSVPISDGTSAGETPEAYTLTFGKMMAILVGFVPLSVFDPIET